MTWHVSPWSRVIALAFRKRSNRNMLIHPARGQADSAVVREGRRLTVGWSYVRRGEGRARDLRAVRWVFAGEWEDWTDARKKLWGLDEEDESVPARL